MLTKYILKQVLYNIVNGKPISSTDIGKGIEMYRSTENQSNIRKKSVFRVVRELRTLSSYWKGFPDSYFRMGMFIEEWKDMEQMKSFVPQDAYNRYAIDTNSSYHLLIDDKIICHDILSYYGFPVTKRYFVFRSNVFRSGNKLLSDEEVNNIIRGIPEDRIFVKRFTGGAATGVSIFSKTKDGSFIDSENDAVTAEMIRDKFKNLDYIFEQQISQDTCLGKFNPDTVNTIRVLTYKDKVVAAAVRFGGKGEFVDNVSAHGVACSLDIETGELGEYGLRMYSTKRFFEHPDSKISFKGTKISQWNQIKELVEQVLKYLPYYNSVGFDIALSTSGPIILEINTGAGVNLTQMGKKYGLEKYFRK